MLSRARKKPASLHGGIIIEEIKNAKKNSCVTYDRDSFYPTEFLELEEVPNMEDFTEVPVNVAKNNKYAIIKFDIMAVKKDKAWGLFLNRQRHYAYEKEMYMFLEEFDYIVTKEFAIKKLENIHYYVPSVAEIPKGMHEYIERKLIKKRKLEAEGCDGEEYKKAKAETIEPLIQTISSPNEGFDRLSFAYLQMICRLKMYKLARKYKEHVTDVFVDSITLSKRIKWFNKENGWKTKWQKEKE